MTDINLFINEITNIEQKEDSSYIVIRNNMTYHIPNNNEYRREYEALTKYIKDNNINIRAYIAPKYCTVDKNSEEYIRTKRDLLLKKADILLLKYKEQVELGIVEENREYYIALLQYKQNLRDITKQIDFPNNVEFPIMP